jgi:hypothetical protein
MAESRADDPLEEQREWAGSSAAGGSHPPRGYATTGEASDASRDLQALAALLETLRGVVPPELQAQLSDLIRQVLLLVRALIDWWVDRIDADRGREPVVEDIPID